jgi:nicotinamide phosphoribosyltransferase
MKETILLTDGYKLDHRRQYPEGTEYVYSNWTPRSCQYFPEAKEGAVVFGIQYFIKEYLIKRFTEDFFNKPKDVAVKEFERRVNTFLGPNEVGTKHIEDLHDLGYLPIRIKALPEGTLCPIRVPALTFINTHPKFFWLTNYFETLISTTLWLPMTSATTARLYKKELIRHAEKTGFGEDVNLDFLCHDFSMRGMAGVEAAIMSGMAHMTSFCGSETIPAIASLEEYYNADADKELIAATIPATEHSVMCAGGKEDELETFRRLITKVYPNGFVSIVSDTWDFWKVMTEYLPKLKEEILARDGRLVIRPDSGDPVEIICGADPNNLIEVNGKYYYFKDHNGPDSWEDVICDCIKENPGKYDKYIISEAVAKGAYELLWETFGGTVNKKGYRVLNPKVGLIYGDSITLERQKEIYKRLEEKGFAATNLVLGVGSFTYQYKSRDSLGFAMKATWCQVNGEEREIFKDPKTDEGTKKSLKGLICVQGDGDQYFAQDQVSKEQEDKGYLQTVFEDGVLVKEWSLADVRDAVNRSIVL